MILHCMKKSLWEERKNEAAWGGEEIKSDGFIHCSTVEYFWRVAPNFKGCADELVLVCIDESKLKSEVRYEDGDNCGRAYPHIYGLVNNDAVLSVLPFLTDSNGDYVNTPEIANVEDK